MDAKPREIRTLGEALQAVVDRARRDGVAAATIRKHLCCHGRYLLRYWPADARLDRLDRAQVEAFVHWARAAVDGDGRPKRARSANSLVEKDLPLLARCLRAAGLTADPVTSAGNRPQRERRATEVLSAREVARLLARIRNEVFRDALGRPLGLPERAHHADVLQLLAESGMRSGELGRIRVADVDQRRRRIRVVVGDRRGERFVAITPSLAPVLRRLVARARRLRVERLVPGGMDYVAGVCAKWKRRLGEPRLSARTLRSSCIALALDGGAALEDVMRRAGHRHPGTTERYRRDREHDEILDRRRRSS